MFLKLTKVPIISTFLILFAFSVFQCKSEIYESDNDYISSLNSLSALNNINLGNLNGKNLEDYDLRFSIGPIWSAECALDDVFFNNKPEKFTQSFLQSFPLNTYETIESDSDIKVDVDRKSDLYYVFTNTTGENKKLPSFTIPGNSFSAPDRDELIELPYSFPYFPTVPDIGYRRCPVEIDIDKSTVPVDSGVGEAKIYFHASYPSDYIEEVGYLKLMPKCDAEECYKAYKNLEGGVKVISKESTENILTWASFAPAWGAFGVFGAIGVLVASIDRGTLYKYQTLCMTITYRDWYRLYFGKISFSDNCATERLKLNDPGSNILKLMPFYSSLENQNDATLLNTKMEETMYYLPHEFGAYKYDFNLVKIFNNENHDFDDYHHNRFWIPVDDYKPEARVYNYGHFNYYNYYNPSDDMALYIGDGSLGFGVYIPFFKWFYPIEPKEGKDGYGYYINKNLAKYHYTDKISEELTDNDQENSQVNTAQDFNSSVIQSSINISDLVSSSLLRIKNDDLSPPLRLVEKNTLAGSKNNNEENSKSLKSNLGDEVGGKQEFVRLHTSKNSYFRNATCKLVRKVDTAFGKRFLVIYEDDNVSSHPSDEEYEKIADAFLKPGDNNDIYDKITNVFGSEWGYLNSTYLKTLFPNAEELDTYEVAPFIPKTNTITLFYTDIADRGESNDYLPAAYLPSDLKLNSPLRPKNLLGIDLLHLNSSNERLMIHLHAPKARGEYLEENIIALACEFERLIHDQYFSPELNAYLSTPIEEDKSGFSDYFFQFLAKLIASSSLRDNSIYTLPSSYNLYSLADTSFTDLFGADKYYLFGLDKLDILSLSLFASKNTNLDCNTTKNSVDYNAITKSVIAMLSYYLYTNFGSGFIQNYTLSSKEGLLGIIDAINQTYDTSYTLSDILLSLATATLLSSTPSQTRPYTFNYLNRFKVQGVDYPNINFANTKAYMADTTGIQSSTSSSIINNSSSFYRVASSFKGKYEAKAPTLPDGLRLTLVAVPTN